MVEFGALNWTILIGYLVINLGIGFFLSKKITTAEDFHTGAKDIPWWAIGISVVATYVSALSFLGGPAWAYSSGMSVMAIHLNYPLVIILTITFFLPFFYNSGVASIYEYVENRFGPKARATISLIFLVTQALSSAAVLYATALVLEFITGVDVIHAIVIITVIALVYTSMGGISAVIWTDVVQALILLVGALIIFNALLGEMPSGLAETLVQLKAEGKTDPLNWDFDLGVDTTIWAGVFAMTLYHTTVYGANQMMVQRTLAAKNIGDAKKSFLMMGFGAFFIYFLFILLGILFYHYYEGKPFENSNTIILTFAYEYGLPGLMGIIAAAVMAASMSSLDSAFNSMSTVSTIDFYQKYVNKDANGEHLLKVTRWFTLFWAVVIIVPAILYSNSQGSILQVLTKVGSYFVGAKLSIFALGFFTRNTSERGLLVGVAVGFVAVYFTATETTISWPWYAVIGGGVNMVVSYVASLLIDGKPAIESKYTVKGQIAMYKEEQLAEKEGNWYVLPGKFDTPSYWLLGFFFVTLIGLWLFNALI